MIVGEAPGADEEMRGEPFVGASGHELSKMLHEAGINRSECFITNVARERPFGNDIGNFIAETKKDRTPAHVQVRDKWVLKPIVDGIELLRKEIEMVKPNIIIALGNTSLWALTGMWGIMKWRGSMLVCDWAPQVKVIPTLHPAAILRQWENRSIAVADIKRAARYRNGEPYPIPDWRFIVRPSFDRANKTLYALLNILEDNKLEISFDIETRAGHIACAGLSWSDTEGICIPLMCVENDEGYWQEPEEAVLVYLLYKILTHKNVSVVGQNLLYDSQYTFRHWHFIPRVTQDTMISHHVAFAGLPKRLDYQASMYCKYYRYWKDDSKNWDPKMGEDQLWVYNLEDCVRTAEVAQAERETIAKLNLQEVEQFQQSMFWPVLKTMIRGVRIDKAGRAKMTSELLEELAKREQYFINVLGHELNPRSPKQMMELFYEDLQLPKQLKRGTGKPTLDDDALSRLCSKEPLIKPLVKAITEYRSIGVFLGTFVQAPLDADERMRCSYNVCGTETYRLSSSENAFGSGTNLQNIPKGIVAKDPDDLSLPNIRKIFIPDPGYTFFDMDLDRADLQVVVWEAEDNELKAMLREGIDIHTENAKTLGCSRQMAKSWVHGTNYGGSPRTMAINCGLTVKDAERMRDRWFAAHPGIAKWHRRTENQLHGRRYVENAFGYRRFYFDRVDALLPAALAWIPQSTVAITINRVWKNIYDNCPSIEVLLQVHDSLAGQFKTKETAKCLEQLKQASQVIIPYADPLIIPTGIKTSTLSWGDCE
jgi:hypothetical protein